MSGRQRLNKRQRCKTPYEHNTTMLTYHKIFKSNPSIYLSNPEPVLSCNEDFLNRLTGAKNTEELHNAKVSIQRDFRTIYTFDATDAEFPETIGYFADDREKCEFVKKKILLQDIALYLGNTFGEYHVHKINTEGSLPEIEGKRLAINYREIYCKAMDDYVETIRDGSKHAMTPDVVDTGVVSKIFKTFKPVAKACIDTAIEASMSEDKQGIAKSVLSISADQLISISNTFNAKVIVLVFDDLERTNVPMKDVLGCINDYVENQHFNTIIVANEKAIREQEDKTPKIGYDEIKEKVVERQLAFQNDPSEIVAAIIEDETKNTGYHSFLIPLKSTLVELFGSGEKKDERPHNIRSLKAAVRSFERVYDKLIEFGIGLTEPQWLYSYVTYTMVYKKGGLEQNDGMENLLDSECVKALYPGFFSSAFILQSIKEWICTGLWNEENIKADCQAYLERHKAENPYDKVRLYNIYQVDDEEIAEGWPQLISDAYEGKLSLNDYVVLVGNYEWLEKHKYPMEPMLWGKLQTGINRKIERATAEKESFGVIRMWPDKQISSYSTEAQEALRPIKELFDSSRFRYANNEQSYVEKMKTDHFGALQIVEDKIMAVFTEEMADVTVVAFERIGNLEKSEFQSRFGRLWRSAINLTEFDREESICGFGKMEQRLMDYQEQCEKEKKRMTAVLTGELIESIDEILEALKK